VFLFFMYFRASSWTTRKCLFVLRRELSLIIMNNVEFPVLSLSIVVAGWCLWTRCKGCNRFGQRVVRVGKDDRNLFPELIFRRKRVMLTCKSFLLSDVKAFAGWLARFFLSIMKTEKYQERLWFSVSPKIWIDRNGITLSIHCLMFRLNLCFL